MSEKENPVRIELRLSPETAGRHELLRREVANKLRIDEDRIKAITPVKRSIDARQRRVMINLTADVHVDIFNPKADIARPVQYNPLPDNAPNAIVVGAGPAGLFAALELIELGIRPTIIERGKDVDSRRPDMARISRQNVVDPDSNYCFGEGGAGAFSDGKLYTRSKKRGPDRKSVV